jgi:hypothetical protein
VTPTTHVHIERLSLRVRGASVEAVRRAADGLGADVARRLANVFGGAARDLAVGDVRAGRVQAPVNASAAQLRSTAADRVSAAVSRRAGGKGR